MESSQVDKTFDVREDCSRQITLMSDNSRQTDRQVPILITNWVSTKEKPSARQIKKCNTLCARDYKGFNNFGMTAVLVIRKL